MNDLNTHSDLNTRPNMFIENKVALITGAASGIGLHYALKLLKNNLRAVTLVDVDSTKGEEAVAQITEDFGANKVLFVKADVTVQKEVEDAFKKTVEKFGNLDIVINNAGIMNEHMGIWEKEIAINVNGTIYGCLLAMEEYLPKYKTGDEGVVVNIASIAALISGCPLPIYCATKQAIIGLGRSLGTPDQYETTKVRVVTICPGTTETPLMHGLDKKVLNERYIGILVKNALEDFTLQSPNVVSDCLVKVLEVGANGSIWVAEDGEIYEIDIPERQQLKKK